MSYAWFGRNSQVVEEMYCLFTFLAESVFQILVSVQLFTADVELELRRM